MNRKRAKNLIFIFFPLTPLGPLSVAEKPLKSKTASKLVV
jgi:hypothetical protein